MSVIIFITYCVFYLKIFFTYTCSVDPDEMQHYATFHLSLHCLQNYSFKGSRIQMVIRLYNTPHYNICIGRIVAQYDFTMEFYKRITKNLP